MPRPTTPTPGTSWASARRSSRSTPAGTTAPRAGYTAGRWPAGSCPSPRAAGTDGCSGSGGRRRRAKQTAPQAGGGSAPGGAVTIDVTALLELAAWCRQRLDDPAGGATCPTPPDALRPPAPDADVGVAQRPAAGVGPPAGRPAEATPRPPRPAPRPTPRGSKPRGGRP